MASWAKFADLVAIDPDILIFLKEDKEPNWRFSAYPTHDSLFGANHYTGAECKIGLVR